MSNQPNLQRLDSLSIDLDEQKRIKEAAKRAHLNMRCFQTERMMRMRRHMGLEK